MVITGRLTTYPGRSQYQIVVETLEPAGLGALMALLEERKRRLTAEGLFDEARKQLLPYLPAVIGVITSPSGAVIRDILHRLADRFPRRGAGLAGESAGRWLGRRGRRRHRRLQCAAGASGPTPRPDLIIVARGGGSLEDLWSFNEEIVVRAAAASFIPLISAVGHETDVTLIDFAADRRAPTPTAAAEMAVPVRAELIVDVENLERRALDGVAAQSGRRGGTRCVRPRARCRMPTRYWRCRGSGSIMPPPGLVRALRANAHIHRVSFSRIGGRLSVHLLRMQVERRRDRYAGTALRLRASVAANVTAHRMRIAREGERVGALAERAGRAMDNLLDARWARCERDGQLLAAFSYRGVLARGFALVRDRAGRPLRTAAAVSPACRSTSNFPTAASAPAPKSCRRPPHRVPNRRGGEDVATMIRARAISSAR